jgi:hypothetical protein
MKNSRIRPIGLIGLIGLIVLLITPLFADAAFIEQVVSRFGCVAGEAITEAQVVAIKSSDGKCYKAKADDSTLRPALGVAEAAAASGANVAVVTRGIVGGLTSLTKGGFVFVDTTAGGTTQTQPTAYSQTVGAAISATEYSIEAGRARRARSIAISVPDPGGADADLAGGYVLWSPSTDVTITKIYHVPQAAWVAAAPANDATVVVTNAAVGAVATLAVQTALAVGSKNDMGTITNANVVANTNVTLAVTANGTANAPASTILIEYIETAD